MTTLEFFKEKADSIDPRIFHEIDGYGNIPAVLRIMELYAESKQKLNIHGIGGPGSDVRSEGEQLGNEGLAKSVCGGDDLYAEDDEVRNGFDGANDWRD